MLKFNFRCGLTFLSLICVTSVLCSYEEEPGSTIKRDVKKYQNDKTILKAVQETLDQLDYYVKGFNKTEWGSSCCRLDVLHRFFCQKYQQKYAIVLHQPWENPPWSLESGSIIKKIPAKTKKQRLSIKKYKQTLGARLL